MLGKSARARRTSATGGGPELRKERITPCKRNALGHALRDPVKRGSPSRPIRSGLDQARRAGLQKSSVLNCQPWELLARLFRR
jgi:hypothetical protein